MNTLTLMSVVWLICAIVCIDKEVAFWVFMAFSVANSIGAEIVRRGK